MKQIPKREGAVLNGYGLSVLSLGLLLFLLPFASTLVISLGETLGEERSNYLHNYYTLSPMEYSGMPVSGSWISSGDTLDAACDEVTFAALPSYPFQGCQTHDPSDLAGVEPHFAGYSPELGESRIFTRGCATQGNSSTQCGNDGYKMRVHDYTFDYSNDVLRELKFSMVGDNFPYNHECDATVLDPYKSNIKVDYRIDYEIWEQQRISPSSPEYWVLNKTVQGVKGTHEFYSLIGIEGSGVCGTYFEIIHEMDFIDSQNWNNDVLNQLEKEIFNIYGQPQNQTVAFVVSWNNLEDANKSIPLSRSTVKAPYETLNTDPVTVAFSLESYETDYWNSATNTLTIILGVVFTLTAFASTPYFNPTKSRIIDRLRDA